MRFYGKIGFVETARTAPGVMMPTVVTERYYYGEVLRWSPHTAVSPDKANDDVEVSNQISIVADSYANSHLHTMKYVTWSGCNWRIKRVNVNYPRLVLEIGGVYPEEVTDDESSEYED